VGFDYVSDSESPPLLQGVDLGISNDARIGIVGRNGIGKSTLLKLITRELEPMMGTISLQSNLQIGFFNQHHADSLDLNVSALQYFMKMYPKEREDNLRGFLGRFHVSGDLAIKPMRFLSGGQKSRVSFAALSFQRPHLILLDEPTNHLDTSSIESLLDALNSFAGAVVVVSHDQYFISQLCNEIWVVKEGEEEVGGVVERFLGSFDEYKDQIVRKTRKRIQSNLTKLRDS